MKSNFKRIFLIGMIIPTLIFLLSLSVFIMYRLHSYNTLKKEKEKTVRVKTEVLVKPNIIIDQKIDSSLNSKNYDKIEVTIKKDKDFYPTKDVEIKKTKIIIDTIKSKSDTTQVNISKSDTIENIIEIN
jgi:hypothetical protein